MLDTNAILAAIEQLRQDLLAEIRAVREDVAKARLGLDEPIPDGALPGLRAAVDEGDASEVAEDSVFRRVRARAVLADIDAKIRAGMEQADRGEVIPFDEVMAELEAIFVAAERKHAAK